MSKSLEEITIEESDFLTHITKPIRNFVYIDSDQSLNDMVQKINAKNEIAARVYEKIGFEKLGEFNTFERR